MALCCGSWSADQDAAGLEVVAQDFTGVAIELPLNERLLPLHPTALHFRVHLHSFVV
jgi:hypothetical protein